MKILETVFFVLMFAVPGCLIILGLANIQKVKTNKKVRNTLSKLVLLGFVINGIIWGAIKMTNDKDKKVTVNENQSQNYDKKDDENKENESEPAKPQGGGQTNEPPMQNEPSVPSNPSTNTSTNNASKPLEPAGNVSSSVTTPKGFVVEVIDGISYVDGYLIVNKTYSLPKNYVPKNTYKTVNQDNCADCLDKAAVDAYNKMKSDAASLGLTLWVASGYRSYNYQTALYNGYVNRNGKAAADTYSARPGHSEHQSGFAFDLNSVSESFGSTKEGIWVNQNCYKYGFILRYPKDKDDETGYIYEPWHLRYVGTDLATKLYNNGDWITMESYFGLTSQYSE